MKQYVEFSQEIFDTVCERLAGGESLRSISRDEKMPTNTAIFNWINKDRQLLEQYTRAREFQAEMMFDDLLDIADDARNDWMERHGKDDAGWVANGEHIQRSRLRVETRKWAASKLLPKKYGDRLDLNHSGGLTINTVEQFVADADDTE